MLASMARAVASALASRGWPRGAEGRHDAVAQIFVERAVVLEHRLLEPGVEGAQQGDDALGRLALGAGVKPTMSANSTATGWTRTWPSGSSASASRSTIRGEK